MTTTVDFSTDLHNWLKSAGLDTIQGSRTDDGRTIICNRGGEIRYFVSFVDSCYATLWGAGEFD
ncbi:Immunity factor for TNT [Mycobacterium innocens]|uniref:Immunity factor for TNT n=1 Tax=Mycobacterium innocens TaxID=2341083 RepID=A0A498Q381_9MYCO|nr:Immunity factor for TNT [Mycobacterium innocens]